VNSGGEPERDNTGLPPVDIEIPDDARELDRDVQAYYREQRAERRRLRHHRLHGRLTRDGILLPLLACCLILALITGTLLTVFTATSDQDLAPVPDYGASPQVVHTRQPLPPGTLTLTASGRQVQLQRLAKALLVLVPTACDCSAAISWLGRIAVSEHASIYLVGTRQSLSEANHLHSGLSASLQTEVPVAVDDHALLARKYPVKGLTAVMVAKPPLASQSAAYAQNLRADDSPDPLVQALNG